MKIQDLKSGDKLLLQIYNESQTGDGGMRLCTFGHLDGIYSYITIDGVVGTGKCVLGVLRDTELTKREGDDHTLYTLQGEKIKEYYVLAETDQFKCPSYFDDLGELKDCSCGKCDVQLIL